MQQLYSLIQPYVCPICNQEMLFFTTRDNKIIDYKKFIDRANTLNETKEYLEKRDIRFIRCIQCEKSFVIDWTHGWPVPVVDDQKLKMFGA